MPRIGTVIREVYRRPGGDALTGHLEKRYRIRVTGATRLDSGVFRIDHDAGPFVPDREHITALAAAVRAAPPASLRR